MIHHWRKWAGVDQARVLSFRSGHLRTIVCSCFPHLPARARSCMSIVPCRCLRFSCSLARPFSIDIRTPRKRSGSIAWGPSDLLIHCDENNTPVCIHRLKFTTQRPSQNEIVAAMTGAAHDLVVRCGDRGLCGAAWFPGDLGPAWLLSLPPASIFQVH